MTASGFDGASVLVVGGAGFVGSNLVRALSEAGTAHIRVIDNLLSSERTAVLELPAVEFTEASITDDRVLGELPDSFNYVFHLATYHGNQSSMHDPLADHENNTLASLKLFNRISGFKNLQRVVYSSAGCTVAEKIYGDARPTTEDDPISLHLDSPYQISKIVGEMYANYFNSQFGLPTVIARFQNVYGPGEILGAGRWRGTPATVWRNVTPTFVYRAIKSMPLALENEGRSSRDFIYIDDIIRGLMLCANRGAPGEIYNLASGVETTIRELADEINSQMDSPAPLEIGPRRPWDHSGNRFGSTVKAAGQLGFEATTTLESGIRRTIDWTRSNLGIIESAISRHREFMEAS
jgi:UDP-glucose 4-epimerase